MKRLFISSGFSLLVLLASAQKAPDTLSNATLQACVQYALKHYPLVQQALLDEQITDRQIKSKLADWYPQIGLNANYQNNFQLPEVSFAGAAVASGTFNNSYVDLGVTQTLFNRDVLLAARTKKDVRVQSHQNTV